MTTPPDVLVPSEPEEAVEKGHRRWMQCALVFGYNELAKEAKTLGEKVCFRMARSHAHDLLLELGGRVEMQGEAEILVLPDPMPRIAFAARDVEFMRRSVLEFDYESAKNGGG
jgi:hypothetical protein